MSKILVSRKDGYYIYGEIIDKKTNKLGNFSIRGRNLNPNSNYPYYTEAENLVNYQIKRKQDELTKKPK